MAEHSQAPSQDPSRDPLGPSSEQSRPDEAPSIADEIRALLAPLDLHPTHEAEIVDELSQHLDDRIRDLHTRGHSVSDARATVMREFRNEVSDGNFARSLSQTTRSAMQPAIQLGPSSDQSKQNPFEQIAQDVRFAIRNLTRRPGFAIVAILTLAIGIGANTAIFSVIRSVLLRPLPYPHAEQLVQVWSDHRALGRAEPEWLTPPDYEDWRDHNRTFSDIAAYQGWFPDITNPGEPESLHGIIVSGNFFNLLDAKPAIGRLIAKDDDNASAEPVVVITDALWRRRFGSDPSIIGKPLTLLGASWTVVGVLPASFHSPTPFTPEIYRAIRRAPDAPCGRGCIVMRAVGRLKAGVSLATAQTDLQRLADQAARDFPRTNEKVGAWLIPLHEQLVGETRKPLIALSGAVAFVLLIGCVNLANLLLVRGAGRGRELGVRTALGAERGRIVRQLLTENLVLAVIGGAIGLVLGVVASRLLANVIPASTLAVQTIQVDTQVLLFALAITVLSAMIFGLLPALHATRSNLMVTLRSSGRETGRHGNRLRSALVVAQLSLAVVLLVGAGLLMRSFLEMQRVDLGYRSNGVLLVPLTFPRARYEDDARARLAIEDLATRLRNNPAIAAAEIADVTPLSGDDQDFDVTPVGMPPNPNMPPSVWYRAVTPGYLTTMRMRLKAGRMLTAQDDAGAAKVGVINEEAARRYFPGVDPVGRLLSTGDREGAPQLTVVGVVASTRYDGPNQPFKSELYMPFAQFPSRGPTFVIEPSHNAADAIAAFRQALHDVDPLIPPGNISAIDKLVSDSIALPKLYATLVGVFATAALLLAALGVYGVMAYAVSQRQREIGVRLALGAEPVGIRRMVLWQGGQLALIGLAIGIGAALAGGRLLSALLFQISSYDIPTLAIASGTLGAMTLIAAWIPARRAMRVDPLVAMRDE